MAQYYGYVSVPHGTYDEFRNATIGNGYDVDYSWGNQCWDYVALLYHQYNLILVTKAGGGTAKDCWIVSRNANSTPPFESITGKENIKRGDVLVFDGTPSNTAGHISIADEDYNGTNTIRVAQQNGITPNAPAAIATNNLNEFLGIFRNTNWTDSPEPTPETKRNKKDKFPWAVGLNHWYRKS